MQRIITFRYIVSAGDASLDLGYSSTSALSLNGGSIKTSAGTDAILTLPIPSTSGSLSFNKNIEINLITSSANVVIPIIEIDGVGNVRTIQELSGTGNLIIPIVQVDGIGSIPTVKPQDVLDAQLVGEPYIDNWAYDISKSVKVEGEVFDDKAINVSIENILSTLRGERLFSPYFGSTLPNQSFEQIDIFNAEDLLIELLEAIELWEDRITIVRNQIEMNILTNEQSMTLVLPYIINRNGLTGRFSRKIVL